MKIEMIKLFINQNFQKLEKLINANIAKAWGTIATTVPWPETYLALSQGVVDGIETAPGPSFDQKHYEVAKYLIRTDHLIYFHTWVISEKSWKSWPENVRSAVSTAAQEAALLNQTKNHYENKSLQLQKIRNGIRFEKSY